MMAGGSSAGIRVWGWCGWSDMKVSRMIWTKDL
jgi:hypothetical protein